MIKFDHVFWSATELLQLAAHRYRLFLKLYDVDGFRRVEYLDFNKSKDLKQFWSNLFKQDIQNKYGTNESVLTYILRHTQLLPRQFLVILDRLIVASHQETGGYRELKSDLAVWAIQKHEESVATEIFTAYYYIYPSSESLARDLLSNFPSTFTYDELEHKWKTAGKPLDYHRAHAGHQGFGDMLEMLLRIGIVGVCRNETERYIEGEFSYNKLIAPNIGQGNKLCVHPIFSKHFSCADSYSRKAVLPSGVPA